MRILLLSSSFNGLTQRVWIELRRAGHDVDVELALSADTMCEAVEFAKPDLIICPFLRERVPEAIWRHRRTVIIHPGPKGDRGPSSLDWAVALGERMWGVTALQAVDEMDAGPIWATRTFPIGQMPRKSDLYNGPVADAAIELVHEVVAKAADPAFVPEPLDYDRRDVIGQLRPMMRQADRAFDWSDDAEHITRQIRAADGSPGVRARLAGATVRVFDAHPGPDRPEPPGAIAATSHGAVLVHTGGGTVWIGHAVRVDDDGGVPIKLPATVALADSLAGVPNLMTPLSYAHDQLVYPEISYRREGDVGWLTFDLYNGAMSTWQCRRLLAAVRHATAQSTRVLVIRGGAVFSNGIHLNVIEANNRPAAEAWRNINAINDICREIITCSRQLVISAISGNAGAGGVMLALGAGRVLIRDGAVLNPHYAGIGLFGSEYWTYVLPRKVGADVAQRLTGDCLPIDSTEAVRIGLADQVVPRDPAEFDAAVGEYAARLARGPGLESQLGANAYAGVMPDASKPLDAHRAEELAEMSRDMFSDRNGFAALRRAFVTKQRPTSTPSRIAGHRPDDQFVAVQQGIGVEVAG